MELKQLNILLLGKTGVGKSSTGNTILNRRVFRTGSGQSSRTQNVSFNFSQIGNYMLFVVDGPGLEDTFLQSVDDKIAATRNMERALAICYEGVDAFLLVFKFGTRFTREDKETVDALKNIFGDKFTSHIIIVVTGGDYFELDMTEMETADMCFHSWCEMQRGEFRRLYDECEGRAVLFNNRERNDDKNWAQLQEVLQLADNLHSTRGRYTNKCFEESRFERNRLIQHLQAHHLKEEFQGKVYFIVTAMEDLIERPSDEVKDMIRRRVRDLRNDIDHRDQCHGVLRRLREMLTKVEECLDNVEKLLALGKDLDQAMQAKSNWLKLGKVGIICGGLTSFLYSVGVAIAAGSAVLSGARYLQLRLDQKRIEQQQEQIKERINNLRIINKRTLTEIKVENGVKQELLVQEWWHV